MNKQTSLKVDNAACLLIDHQSGTLLLGIGDISPVELKNNTLFLAEVARLFNLPTLLTSSNAHGPNGPLLPELYALHPHAPVIERTLINAWDDKNFTEAVEKTGRTHLIMAGVTTDVCLAFPAIAAAAAGYTVYAVIDASGTWNNMVMQTALQRLTQAGVIVTNTIAVAAELQKDWTLPTGKAMGELFSKYVPHFGMLVNNQLADNDNKIT